MERVMSGIRKGQEIKVEQILRLPMTKISTHKKKLLKGHRNPLKKERKKVES